MLIAKLFNYFHMFILVIPFLLYLQVPKRGTLLYLIYIWTILFMFLLPLHWVFFNDQCLFTLISKWLGDYKDTETTSAFSETNLYWLYGPIMHFFGWKWDSKGLDKMVNLHWAFNYVVIWYYIFFRLCVKC
jgi:hypothetical protein